MMLGHSPWLIVGDKMPLLIPDRSSDTHDNYQDYHSLVGQFDPQMPGCGSFENLLSSWILSLKWR